MKPMPNKGTFVFGNSGEKEPSGTKIIKGQGDLRGKPSQNGGSLKGSYNS